MKKAAFLVIQRTVFAIFTLAILLNVGASEMIAALTLRSLKIDRITARDLMLEVPCQPSCEAKVTWEYKVSSASGWISGTGVRHAAFNDTYYLANLQPDTLYHVRARLDPPGAYTSELTVRTCSAQPPPVTALRVANAGPGWLDVRWTPPVEDCGSRFYYIVRYGADGSALTPSKTYGMYEYEARFLRFGPTHPCITWPREFCLLLTDSVQPGKNHMVEVQVVRVVRGSTSERSAPVRAVGVADTSGEGLIPAVLCTTPAPEREAAAAPAQCPAAVPPWVAVLGWILVVLLVTVMAVTWVVERRVKEKALINDYAVNFSLHPKLGNSAEDTSPRYTSALSSSSATMHVYDELSHKPQAI